MILAWGVRKGKVKRRLSDVKRSGGWISRFVSTLIDRENAGDDNYIAVP